MPSNLVPRGERVGARVTVAGTQVWLGTFDGPEAAREAVQRARGGWRPDVKTVAEWAASVWTLFPGDRDEGTTEHYRAMCAPFVRRHGGLALAGVDPLLAQAWAARHGGHVPYLRRMFGKAVKAGLLEANPFGGVEVSSAPAGRRPPTEAELAAIVRACSARGGWWLDFGAFILTAAFSGARLSGIADLQVGDIDLQARRMTVTEKGAKTRKIAILAPLRPVLAEQVEDRVGRVFSSSTGKPLDRKSVSAAWRRVADEVGFSGSFHSGKHYAATWLKNMGATDTDIAVQLGHTDEQGRPYTELVQRVYAHPDHELALARLEGLAG